MLSGISENKRIAKNTLLLSIRTFVVMLVTLFTSRIVLQALGVEEFGVYSAVGGVVAMFTMVTNALSGAISRFLTYELGTGNLQKLCNVYSTSINAQIILALLITILTEIIGVWMLENKMVIPEHCVAAAYWVLHFSLITFFIQLVTVPFRSLIIAYERMSAFAYFGVIEVMLKLAMAYLLFVAESSKLTLYALLLMVVAISVLLMNIVYCRAVFKDVHYKIFIDWKTLKEMLGFSVWSLIPNTAYLINTQGINVLMNLFFGVTANAARGIASQVESAIVTFVGNFTTALNPPITKAYASGDVYGLIKLINRGVKFSFFIMLMFVVPMVTECEQILHIWLGEVPLYVVTFTQCGVFSALVLQMGNPMLTGILATGNIRRYQIIVTSCGCLVFPLSWLAYYLEAPPQTSYIIFIIIYFLLNFIRLDSLKRLINFPVKSFITSELTRMLLVLVLSFVPPMCFIRLMPPTFLRLVLTVLISLLSTMVCIYAVGLKQEERVFIINQMILIMNKFIKK